MFKVILRTKKNEYDITLSSLVILGTFFILPFLNCKSPTHTPIPTKDPLTVNTTSIYSSNEIQIVEVSPRDSLSTEDSYLLIHYLSKNDNNNIKHYKFEILNTANEDKVELLKKHKEYYSNTTEGERKKAEAVRKSIELNNKLIEAALKEK